MTHAHEARETALQHHERNPMLAKVLAEIRTAALAGAFTFTVDNARTVDEPTQDVLLALGFDLTHEAGQLVITWL